MLKMAAAVELNSDAYAGGFAAVVDGAAVGSAVGSDAVTADCCGCLDADADCGAADGSDDAHALDDALEMSLPTMTDADADAGQDDGHRAASVSRTYRAGLALCCSFGYCCCYYWRVLDCCSVAAVGSATTVCT